MADQYQTLLAQDTTTPLSPDPFKDGVEEAEGQQVVEASWVTDTLTLFNGGAWDFSRDGPPADWAPGLYALYADVDIQV